MNFKTIFGAATLATSVLLAGCMSTSSSVKYNEKYSEPVAVSAQNPALIFPVSLHGVPGNSKEIGLAITGGVAAQYGTSVISAQTLYDVVGNVSWTLGEGMRRNVAKDVYSISAWSDNRTVKDLQVSMEKLTSGLRKSGLADSDFSFENVIVLHVDSSGGIAVPGIKRVTAFGGLINVKTLEVISYIEKDLVLGNDSDAILAQMPLEMNNIVAELVKKSS